MIKYKVKRISEFEETRHAHNFWEYISSIVGDDGVNLSIEERKYRAAVKFNTERMGPNK